MHEGQRFLIGHSRGAASMHHHHSISPRDTCTLIPFTNPRTKDRPTDNAIRFASRDRTSQKAVIDRARASTFSDGPVFAGR